MRRTTHYQAPIAAPATPSRSSRLVAKLGDQVDVIIVLVYLEQSVDVGDAGEELENLGFFLQAITVRVVEEEALLDGFAGEGLGGRQAFWNSVNLGISMMGFITFLSGQLKTSLIWIYKDKGCNLIMTYWDIWEARNEKLWLNRSPNPHITFQRAMCLLDDWRQAQPPRFTTHQLDEQYIEKWTKPEEGWLKANVDATFDFANNKMDL
nr:uncharacterized protein LOC109157617 [Ipomoea trifida]